MRPHRLAPAIPALLLVLAAGAPVRLGGETFRVGDAAGCTFPSVTGAFAAAAANGAEPDEIRVQGSYYDVFDGPVPIDLDMSGDLLLAGGYVDCTDTRSVYHAILQTVSGGGFHLSGGAGGTRTFTIERISLAQQLGTTGVGAVLEVAGDVHVEARDAWFLSGHGAEGGSVRLVGPGASLRLGERAEVHGGSTAGNGGGIFLDGASLVLDEGALVDAGWADGEGGGIACRGGGEILLIDGRVANNQAAGNGGGIALDGCVLTQLGQASVTSNWVLGGGGGAGIFATGGSLVTLLGPTLSHGPSSTPPPMLAFNMAAARGGGILLSGAGTFGALHRADVIQNHAGSGGGLAVEAGARLEVYRSTIAGNDAPSALAAVAAGGGSELVLESTLLNGQVGGTLIGAENGGTVTAGFVTSVGNDLAGGAWASASGAGSTIGLFSSLVLDGRVFAPPAAGAQYLADCVIALDLTAFPAEPRAGSYLAVSAPGDVLLWPGSRVTLRLDSPALDFCDDASYAPVGPDFEGESRPWDQAPPGSARFGLFDLGADESRAFLFVDHEEGDCSDWSSSSGCP